MDCSRLLWTRLPALLWLTALAASAVAPAADLPRGLFDVYAANRAEGRPNWITADFVLLGYSMALDRAIGEFEEQVMLPECVRVVERMSRSLVRMQCEDKAGAGARGYLKVLHALLTGADVLGHAPAAEEVRRIRAGAGIERSGLTLQTL